MTERELSKYDFEAIDSVFEFAIASGADNYRIQELKNLFAKAHTGWLEIEEE